MKSVRSFAKQVLFGAVPFVRGRFSYFGHPVFFPLGSHIFKRACREGIYEQETLDLLLALVRPQSTYLDVGANIGLLSIPVLVSHPNVNVVSIEASPETLTCLRK